ncbi:hypothetical protein F4680DRAFT_439857 [Xylaria scruposa]|nr:hypothetical protein F4680DRAFT_439857 [Xylaria scruposa]
MVEGLAYLHYTELTFDEFYGLLPEVLPWDCLVVDVLRKVKRLDKGPKRSIASCYRYSERSDRTGPADESVDGKVRDYLHIVYRTLMLLKRSLEGRQIERDDLITQIYLRMIYTASLIHLYAKNIWVNGSYGLLRYNELVADAYTSYEGFEYVMDAYFEVWMNAWNIHG